MIIKVAAPETKFWNFCFRWAGVMDDDPIIQLQREMAILINVNGVNLVIMSSANPVLAMFLPFNQTSRLTRQLWIWNSTACESWAFYDQS